MNERIEKIFDITGKSAVITGGCGMLGLVFVSALLDAGAYVAVFDKKIMNVRELRNELKRLYGHNDRVLRRVELYSCDISDEKSVSVAFRSFKEKFKLLNILINNASLVKQVGKNLSDDIDKPFEKMHPVDWEQYFKVDLTGAILMVQNALPLLKKARGGVVVNISSIYGILSPDQRLYEVLTKNLTGNKKIKIEKPIGYSVSKSGILNLTRYLATMFSKYKIRVNTLTPGGIFCNNPKEFVKAYAEKTPINRMADKEELRGPILFLVSDASSYMTGGNLVVDGGWSAW